LGTQDPRFGILVTTLAQILQETGKLNRAQQLCQQAVNIFEKAGEANRIDLAEKKYNEAEPLLREAVAITKQQFRAGHPQLRNTLLTYCYVLEKLSRSAEAAHHRAEADWSWCFRAHRT
jgi:hypothetical protein